MFRDAFRNQVVIVTGASSGIGRELALQLADQRARLVLAARGVESLEEAAAACRSRGAEAIAIPTDVTDETRCRNLVERTVDACDCVDAVFLSHGCGVYGRFEDLPDLCEFRRTVETNLMGAVAVTWYALPHLKAARGRIVAISSLAGKVGFANATSYSASKFALAGFCDSLRVELADSGVSVTVAYPSLVATPFHEHCHMPDGRPIGPPGWRVYGKGAMTPEVCARKILKGAARRRRHLLMPFSARLAARTAANAPRLMDRIVRWIGREHTRRLGDAGRDRDR
jgi:short-subunit dehydrogenase